MYKHLHFYFVFFYFKNINWSHYIEFLRQKTFLFPFIKKLNIFYCRLSCIDAHTRKNACPKIKQKCVSQNIIEISSSLFFFVLLLFYEYCTTRFMHLTLSFIFTFILLSYNSPWSFVILKSLVAMCYFENFLFYWFYFLIRTLFEWVIKCYKISLY